MEIPIAGSGFSTPRVKEHTTRTVPIQSAEMHALHLWLKKVVERLDRRTKAREESFIGEIYTEMNETYQASACPCWSYGGDCGCR